ncbi:MAG: hypothetical protein AAGA20_23815 [Planctomycetota bacterium]
MLPPSALAALLAASIWQEPAPDPVPAQVAPPPEVRAAPKRWRVEVEAGPVWSARNDVRIPGDGGTEFSFEDLTGSGPWPIARATVEWDLNDKHGLRLLYAPVRTDGTGTLNEPVFFDGVQFAPGEAEGRYRFDTWRLAWRYRFHESERWTWRAGLTGLLRDASIEVRQGSLSARKDDLGFVPLLNLTGEWRFEDRWTAILDFEGAAAPQGRALDLSLRLAYDIDDRSSVAVGWRTIEGGADNDEVYTFSWFNALVVSYAYRF